MPSRAFQVERQIIDHRIGRSQAFAQVREQALHVHIRCDGKQGVGLVGRFVLRGRLEIGIESPVGSIIDFLLRAD